MQYVTLHNGVKMPQLGLGVYQISNDEMSNVIQHAFEAGYRAIDTAQAYRNESGLGEALNNSNIPRDELFITTKVWNSHHGYDEALEAFKQSLANLQLDYIDLYLVHWPAPKFNKYIDTYKALERLYEQGKVRAIGVCNFDLNHLEHLFSETTIKPVVNQVECHPYYQQQAMKQFCHDHGIYVQSWSPLYRGKEVLSEQMIQSIAKEHNKTAAQIILRWHLQENSIIIPKSANSERLKENIDIFDFSLTNEQMKLIKSLDQNKRLGPIPEEMHNI